MVAIFVSVRTVSVKVPAVPLSVRAISERMCGNAIDNVHGHLGVMRLFFNKYLVLIHFYGHDII